MKAPLIPSILACALVATVVSGMTAFWIGGRPGPAESRRSSELAQPRAQDATAAALREELETLGAENDELRRRLNALEARPVTANRAPVDEPLDPDAFVTFEEFEEFQKEMRRALGTRNVEEKPVAFRQEVADALTEIRKKERVDQVRGYQEKRTARIEADLAKMEDWLELAPHQVDGVREVLVAQYEREAEVVALWEAGESDELVGEHKRSAGESFRAEMELVLDEQQFETFWTTVVEGRGGKD